MATTTRVTVLVSAEEFMDRIGHDEVRGELFPGVLTGELELYHIRTKERVRDENESSFFEDVESVELTFRTKEVQHAD